MKFIITIITQHILCVKKFLNIEFRTLLFLCSFLIIILSLSSCKDSYGVDPNVLKNQVNGDTIRVDTTFINFKKVIIREIVKNNVIVRDTERIKMNVPLSFGSIKNFSIIAIYTTLKSPDQYMSRVESIAFLKDFNPKIFIDYNNYLPKINIALGFVLKSDSLKLISDIDTLNKVDVLFSNLDYFYLASETQYDLTDYIATGAKADIWLNSRQALPFKFDGLSNGFHIQALNTIVTAGKISHATIKFSANIDNLYTGCLTSVTCTFNIVFN